MAEGNSRIGATAHLTAAVWYANGLSPRALSTPFGRLLYRAVSPLNAIYHLRGHRSLEDMLLARHAMLDAALSALIEGGGVSQILELAAGMSGRGARLAAAYPAVRYVESDLAGIVAEKREALDRGRLARENLSVVSVDVLDPNGLASIESALAAFDASRGVAIVSEGLVPYLDEAQLASLWRRLAAALSRFPQGVYLTDLNPRADVGSRRTASALHRALRRIVRDDVTLHFATAEEAERALHEAGFADVAIAPATDAEGRADDGKRPVVRIARASLA